MTAYRKSTAILITIIFCITGIYSQNRPFPQQVKYPHCIKPNHVTQSDMNSAVTAFYEKWKEEMLRQAGNTVDGYYIYTGGGTGSSGDAVTVSEAHGYGMIVFALIAGYDADAKNYFDGMYKVFRDHPCEVNNDLMAWEIRGGDGFELEATSSTATDGDLDMAYALLLAHDQWGSDGAVNYLDEAKKMIAAIKAEEIGRQSKRILLGSWDNNQWSTRSSDWMAGHLHAFYDATAKNSWNDAAETVYEVFAAVRNSSTGLVPDFVVGETPKPADPNFLEGTHDGDYYHNACRVPWRIAMDYAHYGTSEAKAVLNTMTDWLVNKTSNNPRNIKNGYTLSGDVINNSNTPWGSYLAPFISGCVVDAKYQDYLNDGWDRMVVYQPRRGYYSETLQLLGQLFVTGNWWKPVKPISIYMDKTEHNTNGITLYTRYSPSDKTITVSYTLRHPAEVTLSCINPRGRTIADYFGPSRTTDALSNTLQVPVQPFSSGVYFLRLSINRALNNRVVVKKVTIVR